MLSDDIAKLIEQKVAEKAETEKKAKQADDETRRVAAEWLRNLKAPKEVFDLLGVKFSG